MAKRHKPLHPRQCTAHSLMRVPTRHFVKKGFTKSDEKKLEELLTTGFRIFLSNELRNGFLQSQHELFTLTLCDGVTREDLLEFLSRVLAQKPFTVGEVLSEHNIRLLTNLRKAEKAGLIYLSSEHEIGPWVWQYI